MAQTTSDADKKTVRLWGVDSIRFTMALIVVLGHLPRFKSIVTPAHYGHAYHFLDMFTGFFMNGPAAVIVFFLISGLCIHFPQRDTLSIPNLSAYYSRRLIRISLPMITALIISLSIGERLTLRDSGIYWSLACEIIYYLLYPGLLILRRSMSWQRMILISFGMAAGAILTNPTAGNYASFTDLLNWVVGLPCWLLGCLLAEQSDRRTTVSNVRLWALRAAAFAAATASVILRWDLPHRLTHGLSIGMPWSLDAFSIVAFVWLGAELTWHRNRQAPHTLEAAGAWSYSLYLMHPVGFWIAAEIFAHAAPPAYLLICTYVLVALATAYIFYRLVEMPSHLTAIKVSRHLRERSQVSAQF